MKYETTQKLIHTGVVLLILAAGWGLYTWHQTNQRVDRLELQQAMIRCPKCPTAVNCYLKMDPIKGELLYKEKK